MKPKIDYGKLLIFSSAVLWGTSGTAQALAPAGATSVVVATSRLLLCGLFLVFVSAMEGNFRSWRHLLRPLFLLTGFVQALFHVSYFGGIAFTGVTIGTMVAIGSCPVFAGLMGGILDKDRLRGPWFLASTLALVGLIILLFSSKADIQIDLRGILLALLAGFSYTTFTWLTRRNVKFIAVDAVLAVSFLIGSVFLAPILFFNPIDWIATPHGLTIVLYLGFISAGLSYMLYGRGLRTVEISEVGTLALAEPLTAAVLGIFLLGEQITFTSACGIALIFSSQLVIILNKKH